MLGHHADIGHYPMTDPLPHEFETLEKLLFIKRDPRNMIVSGMRDKGMPVCQGAFLSYFRSPEFQEIHHFTPWLKIDCFQTSYEALMADDRELRRLAEYLGIPFLDDAWNNIPGHTRTWRVPHSDYTQVWTPTVREQWIAEGGNEILRDWGYLCAES